MELTNCPKCNRSYPIHLINEMCINGRYQQVCPLCALRAVNEPHGFPKSTPFRGEQAAALFVAAVDYLRTSNQTIGKNARKAYKASK